MAKIQLSPMFSSLSGTIGDMTFKTINGQTYAFQKAEPKLPENATREQKKQYKKRIVVNECVQILQGEIEDIMDAINKRPAIRAKIGYWYDKFAPHIKARTKLQAAIISAYKDPENGSRMIRGFLGNGSVKSEKENEGVSG